MSQKSREFCNKAVAYLKPALLDSKSTVVLPLASSPVVTDLGNGLVVTYIVDENEVFKYVQYRDLTGADLTVEKLHENAVENLANEARTKPLTIKPYGNIFAMSLEGNFEASLILVDSLWTKGISHLTPNGAIVAIPCRDILSFCDAGSEAGIEELRQLVIRVEGGNHPISPILYRRQGSAWRKYAD